MQILGALLGLAGVAGFAGGHSRSANLLNMSVVVSIIGLLIAFQFIGEVSGGALVMYEFSLTTAQSASSA